MKKNKTNLEIEQPFGVASVYDDTLALALAASKQPKGNVLDMGTGTGYVAIFLAKNGFEAQGADINEKAIDIAKKNMKTNGVSCHFFASDLFKNVNGKFDMITFNPPLGNEGGSRLFEFIKSVIRKNRIFQSITKPVVLPLLKKNRKKLISRFVNECVPYLEKNGFFLIVLDRTEVPWAKKIIQQKMKLQIIPSPSAKDAHIVLKAILK